MPPYSPRQGWKLQMRNAVCTCPQSPLHTLSLPLHALAAILSYATQPREGPLPQTPGFFIKTPPSGRQGAGSCP